MSVHDSVGRAPGIRSGGGPQNWPYNRRRRELPRLADRPLSAVGRTLTVGLPAACEKGRARSAAARGELKRRPAYDRRTRPANSGPDRRAIDHTGGLQTTPADSGPHQRTADHTSGQRTRPADSGPDRRDRGPHRRTIDHTGGQRTTSTDCGQDRRTEGRGRPHRRTDSRPDLQTNRPSPFRQRVPRVTRDPLRLP